MEAFDIMKAKEKTWTYSEEELGRRPIKKMLGRDPENILLNISQHTHVLTVGKVTRQC